eukprot:CAMPEP_0167756874 /NCGR_PEP_ID=MMETSP0110_2-20121227/9620_1 /TAXON_ID=629695 /ORGANISM="Gymnochlora sp., Strain CCMP2014" /LENGTH=290 /DNA_ID=CAMNT_0007643017 /DNA_START=266 /DNA_END=1138 /DNA_ORIENTATION=+
MTYLLSTSILDSMDRFTSGRPAVLMKTSDTWRRFFFGIPFLLFSIWTLIYWIGTLITKSTALASINLLGVGLVSLYLGVYTVRLLKKFRDALVDTLSNRSLAIGNSILEVDMVTRLTTLIILYIAGSGIITVLGLMMGVIGLVNDGDLSYNERYDKRFASENVTSGEAILFAIPFLSFLFTAHTWVKPRPFGSTAFSSLFGMGSTDASHNEVIAARKQRLSMIRVSSPHNEKKDEERKSRGKIAPFLCEQESRKASRTATPAPGSTRNLRGSLTGNADVQQHASSLISSR